MIHLQFQFYDIVYQAHFVLLQHVLNISVVTHFFLGPVGSCYAICIVLVRIMTFPIYTDYLPLIVSSIYVCLFLFIFVYLCLMTRKNSIVLHTCTFKIFKDRVNNKISDFTNKSCIFQSFPGQILCCQSMCNVRNSLFNSNDY